MAKIDYNKAGFDTAAIHAGYKRDSECGALATPIYQTSTFTFTSADHAMGVFAGEIPGYDYTRSGNPTVRAFEEKIAQLECAEDAVATSSGMGAVGSIILGLLKSGDHIVSGNTVYGCTDAVLREILPDLQITTTFVDVNDLKALEDAIQENTKMIYFETPANPTLQVADIYEIARIKEKYPHIKVVVDNTFAPPPIQFPIKLGADLVLHSITKYINGHGDVIGGVVCGNKEDILQIKTHAVGKLTGTPLTPFCAYMVLRGMKTLGLRVERHSKNALELAEFLETLPEVQKVYYPGLKSMGKEYEIAKKQMNGLYSGVIAFVLKEGVNGKSAFEAAKSVLNELKIASIAVSLGDPDTLIQHPASMTHGRVPKDEREKLGITDGMLRVSVGLETIEDLIADFNQAIKNI